MQAKRFHTEFMNQDRKIGCFISPHGLGHATRVCAILSTLQEKTAGIMPHLFTSLPSTVFKESLGNFIQHSVQVDIGLSQRDSLVVDLETTINDLEDLLPYPESLVDKLADECRDFSCILCDIAPLGILVAKRISIPSVLIENFTWDWIYQPYTSLDDRLLRFSRYLSQLFRQADYHVQTEPICHPADADLHCGPVFRQIRSSRETIRKQLGCKNLPVVLITMGGIELELPFIDRLGQLPCFFVLVGQPETKSVGDNTLLLGWQNGFFHPDLVNAADLVLCKSGYSTIAECYQAGARVCCVSRDIFPESKMVERFVKEEMNGSVISTDHFLSGSWLSELGKLLDRQPAHWDAVNGASEIADYLIPLLSTHTRMTGAG